MNKGIAEERRKHIRVPVKFLPLVDISPNQDPKILFSGTIVEICEGGVLLQLPDFEIAEYIHPLRNHPLSPLDVAKLKEYEVWLNFSLPEQEHRIKVLARILRAEKDYHLALQFLDLSQADQKRVQEFVDKED